MSEPRYFTSLMSPRPSAGASEATGGIGALSFQYHSANRAKLYIILNSSFHGWIWEIHLIGMGLLL